jgi:hypothetical protein
MTEPKKKSNARRRKPAAKSAVKPVEKQPVAKHHAKPAVRKPVEPVSVKEVFIATPLQEKAEPVVEHIEPVTQPEVQEKSGFFSRIFSFLK